MALRTFATRKTLGELWKFQQQVRGLQTFTLPDLSYDYGALEPAISREIMQLHHQKHHQTYITNYNKALEQLDDAIAKGDASTAVKLQSAIKFNGGGHVNHSIFWKNLAPTRWLAVDKELKRLVVETTANQDPLVTKGSSLVPLVGYLQYKNVRPDYLKNIWKVINWKYSSQVYEQECP